MTAPQELAERALEAGAGADACIAIADELGAVHLRWADGSITTSGATRSRRLTIVAFAGGSAGVASSAGGLDDMAVRDLVDAARQAARRGQSAGAEPLVGGDPAADWSEPPEHADVGVLAPLAGRLRVAVERARSRRSLLSGYAENQVRTTYLASSTGLRLRHAQPTGLVDLMAARPGGSATWTGIGAAAIDGVDLVALADGLEPRLDWAGRRCELRDETYEVLLSPSCVADLMLRLYRAAGAREALEGQAVFGRPGGGTRLRERLSSARLTLRSHPREPGLECAPFMIARASDDRVSVADNGLALGPVHWIDDGVLSALVQTRESAATTGEACSPEVDNLILEGEAGGRSMSEMIAASDRALLLTSLWYVRDVDPRRLLVTGLTRDGVYLVERGEVVGAVPDFRFNESPVELLGRVIEAGRSEPALPREWGDYFTRIAMPPLRVEGFAALRPTA